jgi:hypothetical protein
MMSCTALAAWSRPISSSCYTEHGQRYGAVMSCRIITVAMFRSGQLGLRCTVDCSGLSACLTGALVTCDRALDICEPSCVFRAASPFFIHGVRGSTRALRSGRRGWGYVAAPEPTSAGRRGPKLRNT